MKNINGLDTQHRRSHVIEYRILDSKRGLPKRKITVDATPGEIQHLVKKGFLIRPGLLSPPGVRRLRRALSEVLTDEKRRGRGSLDTCFGSSYVRHLLDKHPAFFSLFRLRSSVSIARAALGPQVKFDEITARVIDLRSQSSSSPWHIHLRVVPIPIPPFFTYPHGIDCLLYLDDIDEESGPLCVLPGSHHRKTDIYPLGDMTAKRGQRILQLNAGDCLMMHANLWHRSLPSVRNSGLRRLIIFGYLPSWVSGEEHGSAKPRSDVLSELRRQGNAQTRELAGEFYWG
jgi:hypothetical protein